jgi:PAS domain S-box-containing protein
MAKIFVVEDSVSQAALLRHLLIESGHQVATFDNGQEAFEALAEMPDLILSDIDMPVMDGLALCNAVKSDPTYQETPFILITASSQLDQLVNGLNAMADGYLMKPYNHNVLIETVTDLLRRRMLRELPLPAKMAPAKVVLGHKTFQLLADRERVFEFFSLALLNSSVQARELEERERQLRETNLSLARHVELLSASEERFRSLVETIPDIVYKVDAKGHFSFINTAIVQLGYEPNELLGKHFSILLHPDDAISASAEKVLPTLEKGVANPPPKLFDERRTRDRMTVGLRVRLQAKNSEYMDAEVQALGSELVFVEVNSMGMYGVSDRATRKYIGTVGVIRDITERLAFEKKLELAKEEAEQASQAKSLFLSNMSHELRTPMNAIIGFAQLLDMDDKLNDDQHENIQEILKAGRHLLELINDVLDLSKVESGRVDLHLEPTPLSRLVRECLDLLRPLAAARQLSFQAQVGDGDVVQADAIRLKQVLINLLSNAIKYNRPGGSIELTVAPVGDKGLRLSVTDSGHGIPLDRQAELFQPFNRLHAERGDEEGSGIGLAITQRLVKLMGGIIGMESTPGQGSTFWVELLRGDCHQPATNPTLLAPILESTGLRSRCVLYIEDNPSNLRLVSNILDHRDHIQLITAHSPQLGIELAQAHQPDLILLDINMPGMDGYEVLNVFKADPQLGTVPVIALTANAMHRDLERGRLAGFTEYLTKPLDIRCLLHTVDHWLTAAQ